MAKVKAQVDGKEVELDLPNVFTDEEVRNQFVPKTQFENETNKYKRLLSKRPKPEELLIDEEFKKQAMTAWGIDSKSTGQISTEQIAQIADGVRAREVNPLKEQLTGLTGQLAKLQEIQLDSRLTAAARTVGVKDEFLTPLRDGTPAPIVSILKGAMRFGFSEEHASHAVVSGDGQSFEYSTKPSNSMPYKTPEEAVAEWSKDKTATAFLRDQRQRIADTTGRAPPSSPSGQSIVRNDPMEIGRNLEGIAKGTVKVSLGSTES